MVVETETKSLKRALRNELGFRNLEFSKERKDSVKQCQFELFDYCKKGKDIWQTVGVLVDTVVLGKKIPVEDIPLLKLQVEKILSRYL
jgi:hypothetical protein